MKVHYKKTEHGVYTIEPLYETYHEWKEAGDEWNPRWEIFAPQGRNWGNNHSYLENSYSDCLEHVGGASELCSDPTDSCCGCGHCGCKRCKEVTA